MKSDLDRRVGCFSISGIAFVKNGGPEGLSWIFEGFIPKRIIEQINTDATVYLGWHPQFDKVDEWGAAPYYEPGRIDGKTVWSRVDA